MDHFIIRFFASFFLKHKVLSIGTKYYPSNNSEREFVEMMNYTQTMLVEIDKATINSDTILNNIITEIGSEYIPNNRQFIELKPAEDNIDEYALLSNIVMGNDRYLYVEIFNRSDIIKTFVDFIVNQHGVIVEQSSSELVAKVLSKNDAIRIGIELIRMGMDQDINVRAAAGMTGAAAIERSIGLNKQIGESSGVGFTKLGGEYALIFNSRFDEISATDWVHDNYLFIDIIDSTKFIAEYGRGSLVEIMTDITNFIESECNGKIEGYRKGGDDFVACFPTKNLAQKAALDSAWHALNNGTKIRAGIGKSRRETAERAQLADGISFWNPSSLIVFEIADGLYGYFIPSGFTRAVLDFIMHKKLECVLIFCMVFFLTFIGWNIGMWYLSIFGILLAILYATTT